MRIFSKQDVLLQMKLIPEATKACGIAHIVVEGFEADDVIATYVRQAMELKHKVSIVTFDRNFLQLVSPSVQLYDIKDKEILDTESALIVWGTSPDRIEHLRAFLGDPNDNIPKVPGVERKFIQELIADYGSVEKIIQDIENPILSGIRGSIELIKRNYQLVKMREDVCVPALETLTAMPIEEDKLMEFLKKYDFKSIIAKWNKDHHPEIKESSDTNVSSKEIQ